MLFRSGNLVSVTEQARERPFTHSGRSQTDLPEDCIAIRELAREVVHTKAADQRRASHHCSDETLTLPDLIGWDDVDNDQ